MFRLSQVIVLFGAQVNPQYDRENSDLNIKIDVDYLNTAKLQRIFLKTKCFLRYFYKVLKNWYQSYLWT